MRIKIIIAVLILLYITPTNKLLAQDDNDFPKWMIGAKTGINISNKSKDKLWGTKTGYNAGVFIDYNFTNVLFLRSGVTWTTKGANATESSKDVLSDAQNSIYIQHKKTNIKYNLNYLHMPLNIGVRIQLNDNCAVNVISGFYVEYGMKIQSTLTNTQKNIYFESGSSQTSKNKNKGKNWKHSGLKRYDIGANITGEFEFRNFIVGFSYESGLIDVEKNSIDKSLFEKWENQNGTFSIGYKFTIK